jgi:hypothetical protein
LSVFIYLVAWVWPWGADVMDWWVDAGPAFHQGPLSFFLFPLILLALVLVLLVRVLLNETLDWGFAALEVAPILVTGGADFLFVLALLLVWRNTGRRRRLAVVFAATATVLAALTPFSRSLPPGSAPEAGRIPDLALTPTYLAWLASMLLALLAALRRLQAPARRAEDQSTTGRPSSRSSSTESNATT